jgi:hypothetical protein
MPRIARNDAASDGFAVHDAWPREPPAAVLKSNISSVLFLPEGWFAPLQLSRSQGFQSPPVTLVRHR